AKRLARRVMDAMPGDAPIVVDSAGCGAAMKAYGQLLHTPEAEAFSRRVKDLHEWLAEPLGPAADGTKTTRLDRLPPAVRRVKGPVAVSDPCHLRHVQRAHQHVRTVLAPYVEQLVELDDEGLCCGAGGAYAAFHPTMAKSIRERKLAAIDRSGAVAAVSANPGCMLHLNGAGRGIEVRHPIELVAEALWPEGVGPGDEGDRAEAPLARAGEKTAG
ncbi:MAG: hypothetical protein J2P59_08490, partial [Acidimicrobiales bacterium]|nr:hypothetical protein [Acidimicrobiales bacterium]